jgi:hypothetical protein
MDSGLWSDIIRMNFITGAIFTRFIVFKLQTNASEVQTSPPNEPAVFFLSFCVCDRAVVRFVLLLAVLLVASVLTKKPIDKDSLPRHHSETYWTRSKTGTTQQPTANCK